jgi:hypothetical protein
MPGHFSRESTLEKIKIYDFVGLLTMWKLAQRRGAQRQRFCWKFEERSLRRMADFIDAGSGVAFTESITFSLIGFSLTGLRS